MTRLNKKLRLLAAVAMVGLVLGAGSAAQAAQELTGLARQVRHELVTLPYYSVFDNFEFRIDGTKVILMGQVTRPTLKTSAERVVKNLESVSTVENRIEVLPVSSNDDRIRTDVYRAIYFHPIFTRYSMRAVPSIHIIVKNGDLILEGVVDSETDKNVAEVQAKGVAGVFSVTNNLVVQHD